MTEPLRDSQWLSLGLTVEKNVLRLRATVNGKTTARNGIASFAWPQAAGEGGSPISASRGGSPPSASTATYAFYVSKDNLFPERTSGLIFFENMMGIFFTGRDLTEEVLSETRPEVRLVVARQQYDPAIGTPQVQLPGFAAVFRLRHPKQDADMTEEAWQKAIGLVNFTRGQKAEPGLILDRETQAGVRFTVGRFAAPGGEGQNQLAVALQYSARDRTDRRLPGAQLNRAIDPRRARRAEGRVGRSATAGGRRLDADRTRRFAIVGDPRSEPPGPGPPEHDRKRTQQGAGRERSRLDCLAARIWAEPS